MVICHMENGTVNVQIILCLELLAALLSLHSLIKGEKLEHREKKYMFLECYDGIKMYRLWDKSQKGMRIIASHDVIYY